MNISIITVCFNAENCIMKTIRSVLNQNCPIYEYIIVDGNSSDKTYEIIKQYDEKFAELGIRYIHISEKDKGISDAFNKGIKLATGELIGLINADDELLPNTVEDLQTICAAVDVGIYFGNCIWVDEKYHREYVSKPSGDLSKLMYHMPLIHPSTFVKKNVYEEQGLFDITYKYCMDKELLYRFHKAGIKFQYVDKELARFKAGGISDTNPAAVFKEGSRMALSYGEPYVKVKVIEHKEYIRHKLVCLLKKTPLYLKLKKMKNNRNIKS